MEALPFHDIWIHYKSIWNLIISYIPTDYKLHSDDIYIVAMNFHPKMIDNATSKCALISIPAGCISIACLGSSRSSLKF